LIGLGIGSQEHDISSQLVDQSRYSELALAANLHRTGSQKRGTLSLGRKSKAGLGFAHLSRTEMSMLLSPKTKRVLPTPKADLKKLGQ
jgi:hypothetical protein